MKIKSKAFLILYLVILCSGCEQQYLPRHTLKFASHEYTIIYHVLLLYSWHDEDRKSEIFANFPEKGQQ